MDENKVNPAMASGKIDGELSYKSVVVFLTGLTVVSAASFALVFGIVKGVNAWSDRNEPELPPMVAANPIAAPPEPRLEAQLQRGAAESARPNQFVTGPLATLRASETERLASYGWATPDKGFARIPVDRAAELALGRGFPTRNPISPPTAGVTK